MFDLPVWVVVVAPGLAVASVVIWLAAPMRRRDPALRGILIVSVGLAAIEAMVATLFLGFLLLMSMSGGIEDF